MKISFSSILFSTILFIGFINSGQAFGQRITLLSGKAIFSLPGNYKPLIDQELVAEFPIASQRPTFAYKNKSDTSSFLINYGSTPAQQSDLPQIKTYLEKLYKSVGGNIINSELKTVNNKKYIVVELERVNATSGLDMFNYMFITTVSGKLLIVNCSSPIAQKSIQEKQAIKIFHTAIIKN